MFDASKEKKVLEDEITAILRFKRNGKCKDENCDGNCWPKPKLKTYVPEKLIVPFLPGLTTKIESDRRTEERHQQRVKSIQDCYENEICPWTYGKPFYGQNRYAVNRKKDSISAEDAQRILNIIIESRDRHKMVYNEFRKIVLERKVG